MTELTFTCRRDVFSELGTTWAEEISAATVNEPYLLSQSSDDLLKMSHEENIIIAMYNGITVGSIVLWDIDVDKSGRRWKELGTVLVLKKYRRRGFGEDILRYAFSRWNGQNIMSTTKNLLYAYIALKNGMVAVYSTQDMTGVIPLTCVCGNKVGVDSSEICPFRDDKCIFLVTERVAREMDCVIRNDDIVQQARNFPR